MNKVVNGYTIESNVPLPKGGVSKIAEQMNVGESVLVDTRSQANFIMTEQLKKPSGVLFNAKQKSNPNQPDKTGHVELDIDMVKALVAKIKANQAANINEHVKINLSCWENIAKSGQPYISVRGSIPQEKKDDDLNDEIPF